MLGSYDYAAIVFYFAFMALVGFAFRRYSSNVSDYFRGGGQILWWMAGASAFMTQFSAWTFTGAASKAWSDGPIILVIFFANAIGFLFNWKWFAAWLRQMRVVTPIDAVRRRFGRTSEQFFTWIQLPIGTIYAGIWLNGLAVFLHAVFGFDLATTIILTGGVVLLVSLTGGAWAVMASDFLQALILMGITVTAAFFAVRKIGGIDELVTQFPAESVFGTGVQYPLLAVAWIAAIVVKQFTSTNSILDASRYLCAKDSANARRAALLAAVLFIVGPIIWFLPPMVAAVTHPNLAEMYPKLGAKASEAAYVAIAADTLPTGMLGLLLCGIFAATMSSMDSGLNRNAGIFVSNFYRPILRKEASPKELLMAGRITTLVLGIVIISVAIYLSERTDMGLFDLMVQFGTLVALPIAIPLILGVIHPRSPDWTGWSTAVVGLVASFLSQKIMTGEWLVRVLDLPHELTRREISDWTVVSGLVVNVVVGCAWFYGTMRIRDDHSVERTAEKAKLAIDLATPVTAIENEDNKDARQSRLMGKLSIAYGVFILAFALIPNGLAGRLAFVGMALLLGGLGAWLVISAGQVERAEAKAKR